MQIYVTANKVALISTHNRLSMVEKSPHGPVDNAEYYSVRRRPSGSRDVKHVERSKSIIPCSDSSTLVEKKEDEQQPKHAKHRAWNAYDAKTGS